MSDLYNPYDPYELDKEINKSYLEGLNKLRQEDKALRAARYKELIKDQYNREIYRILNYDNILAITRSENPSYDELNPRQQDNLFYLTARKVFAYVEYFKVHYHYLGALNMLTYFDWNIIFNSLMILNENDINEFLKNGDYGQNLPLNTQYFEPKQLAVGSENEADPRDKAFIKFNFLENKEPSFINVNHYIYPLYPEFEYTQENRYLNEYFNYIINSIVEFEKKNLGPDIHGGIFKKQFSEVKESGNFIELGKKIIETIGILSFKEWIVKQYPSLKQDGGRKYKRKTNKHRNNKHRNNKRKTHRGGFMYEKTKNKFGVAKRYRKTKSKSRLNKNTTRKTTRKSTTRKSTTRKSTTRKSL